MIMIPFKSPTHFEDLSALYTFFIQRSMIYFDFSHKRNLYNALYLYIHTYVFDLVFFVYPKYA